jgi:hypothetical protein
LKHEGKTQAIRIDQSFFADEYNEMIFDFISLQKAKRFLEHAYVMPDIGLKTNQMPIY